MDRKEKNKGQKLCQIVWNIFIKFTAKFQIETFEAVVRTHLIVSSFTLSNNNIPWKSISTFLT